MPLLWDWKTAAVAEALEYIWSTGLYYYCVHTCSRVYVGVRDAWDVNRAGLADRDYCVAQNKLSKLVAHSPDRAAQL
jgi:hypothetical protein